MPSYPQEKKAEILAMIEKEGITKTFEATHIARGTLYKWRNESQKNGEKDVPPAKTVSRKKKNIKQTSESIAVSEPPEASESAADADMSAIKAALAEEDGLREKVQSLEAENARLRDKIVALKKMLRAVIDG